MEIILVRHSNAEDRADNLDDRQRHLTQKGIDRFNSLMPKLKDRITSLRKDKIIIWSSPAFRALETAEILADSLNISEISQEEFIYSGDFDDLADKSKNLDDDATLFIVGHEPTLSMWADMLGENQRVFKKGQMISLTVTERESLKADLNWKIIP